MKTAHLEDEQRLAPAAAQCGVMDESELTYADPSGMRPQLARRLLENSLSRELGRYIFMGSFAFVCDASILYVLTQFLRVYYLISAAAGFGAGIIVSYLLSRSWVFERRSLTNTPAEVVIFSAIGVAGLAMNEAILWTFQAKLGISYLIAKVVSGGTVFVWNFGVRKITLFR